MGVGNVWVEHIDFFIFNTHLSSVLIAVKFECLKIFFCKEKLNEDSLLSDVR